MAIAPTDVLGRVPLLAGLEQRDLERLARQFRERTFPQGATVTQEGERGVGFFVITEGEATITISGEVRGRSGPGDYFGEIALIDEGPRSATITAETDLRCLAISAWEFRPFVEEHPHVAWTLLETLARRLRVAQSG